MLAHNDSLTDPLSHSIDYWIIEPRDRHEFRKWIMPYMSMELPKTHSLQLFVQRHPWSEEFIKNEDPNSAITSLHRFDRTTAVFDIDPKTLTADLSRLTRLLSFTLVRYAFRTRVYKGSDGWRSCFDTMFLDKDHDYTSAMSEQRERKLVRSPRYGPSFYNECYQHARKRDAWTTFCKAVQNFCRSVGFTTPVNDPERNVWKLRERCESFALDRKMSSLEERLRGELSKNLSVARKSLGLARGNLSFGPLNASLNYQQLQENQRSEQRLQQEIQSLEQRTRQEIRDSEGRIREDMQGSEQRILSAIQSTIQRLEVSIDERFRNIERIIEQHRETTHQAVQAPAQTENVKFLVETFERRFQEIIDKVEQQGAASQQTTRSLEVKIDGLQSGLADFHVAIQDVKTDIAVVRSDCETLLQSFKSIELKMEAIRIEVQGIKLSSYILKKRGVLENLIEPQEYWKQKNGDIRKSRLGLHWGEFWNNAWERAPTSPNHPLHQLFLDQNSDTLKDIGGFLYKTLSELIHDFISSSDVHLEQDAKRILDALTPKCLDSEGNIDWVAERMRYT